MDTIIEIAGRLQDAAIDPRRWSLVLEALKEAFDAKNAAITMTSPRPPIAVLSDQHTGIRPTAGHVDRFVELQHEDPRIHWALQNFGRAGASNLDIGMERMRNSDMYRHLLYDLDIEYTLLLPELVDDRIACTLTLDRGRSQEAFRAEEVAALQRLQPLFARAIRTQLRLGRSENMLRDLREALDRLPVGVLLVDHTRRVSYTSDLGERLLADDDGLSIRDGELHAEHFGPERRLQGALAQALGAARGEMLQTEDTLTVKRRSGRRDFELLVAPLRGQNLDLYPNGPGAIVIINDPEQSAALPWKLVQQLYGLSPAESRLSVALARGWPLKDYAKRTDISVETARSQLKAAMSKTGTHRQVELIRLLLTGPAAYALLEPDGNVT